MADSETDRQRDKERNGSRMYKAPE